MKDQDLITTAEMPREQGAGARFTAGPWHIHAIDDSSACGCFQITAEHHPIGRVERGKWGDHYLSIRQVGPSLDQKFEPYTELIEYGEIPQEVALANARLIAAAPELYAALEKINLFACYASEENTDAREGILLEIGKAARKAMALTETETTK